MGFPGGSTGKEFTCNVGDLGLIPGLGRSPGEGKGYLLQYSGLENSMDCIVHGVTESDTTEWLSFSNKSRAVCTERVINTFVWFWQPGKNLNIQRVKEGDLELRCCYRVRLPSGKGVTEWAFVLSVTRIHRRRPEPSDPLSKEEGKGETGLSPLVLNDKSRRLLHPRAHV